jgi:hypothetical protein
MVVTLDTLQVRIGGKCTDEGQCADSYGMSVAVTEQPRVGEIPWTSLRQEGWGTPVLFDVREIIDLQWQVPGGPPSISASTTSTYTERGRPGKLALRGGEVYDPASSGHLGPPTQMPFLVLPR